MRAIFHVLEKRERNTPGFQVAKFEFHLQIVGISLGDFMTDTVSCDHVLVKNFRNFNGPNPGGPFRWNAAAVKVSRYGIILNYVFTRYLIVYLQ